MSTGRGRAQAAKEIGFGRQGLRIDRFGHFRLVLEAVFRRLERGGEVEDLLAMLDRGDAARGEGAAVTGALHLVKHGGGDVPGTNEIGVQRVADAVRHRLVGGQKGLGDHQAAEDAGEAVVRADAPEQVHLDRFEVQDVGEVLGRLHGALR